VAHLAVTPDKKAALILEIANAGFTPFHANSHCSIRPQSLIGERYVECTPGTSAAPELRKIPEGSPGAGERLLPLSHTSSPVDVDLVSDVLRLPFRQRLTIIVNEFGTGLAGRGRALNEAIHRANPALRETDRVLAILARQNRTLAKLAADSDAVLAPLAARRKHLSHFVVAANATGRASAERSADIERTLERLPVFLRGLQPTLRDLGDVSDQMTPVLSDLDRAAPDVNRFVGELGPFARAGTPAVVSLGRATAIGRPALVRSLPSVRLLARFARNAGPVGRYVDAVARSLNRTGGLERVLDYVFYGALSVSVFDSVSHYLRVGLITNPCSAYAIRPVPGCNANFTPGRALGAGTEDPVLAKTRAVLAAQQAPPPKRAAAGGATGRPNPFTALHALTDPRLAAQRRQALDNARGGGRRASPYFGPQTARDQALDYLLGNDPR
jgi:hypothetical protein